MFLFLWQHKSWAETSQPFVAPQVLTFYDGNGLHDNLCHLSVANISSLLVGECRQPQVLSSVPRQEVLGEFPLHLHRGNPSAEDLSQEGRTRIGVPHCHSCTWCPKLGHSSMISCQRSLPGRFTSSGHMSRKGQNLVLHWNFKWEVRSRYREPSTVEIRKMKNRMQCNVGKQLLGQLAEPGGAADK